MRACVRLKQLLIGSAHKPLPLGSDSYIVRVKALVMTRDDSSGGWLAQDGCLSRVGVCRLLPPELLGRNSFLIHGERLKDRQVGAPGHPGGGRGWRSWKHTWLLVLLVPGDSGVFPEEGPGVHQGHAHIPPLEGGQPEVWPDLPEFGRCQSVRPGGEEGAGGPDGRSESPAVGVLAVLGRVRVGVSTPVAGGGACECGPLSSPGSTTSSSTLHNEVELGDDDVFTVRLRLLARVEAWVM